MAAARKLQQEIDTFLRKARDHLAEYDGLFDDASADRAARYERLADKLKSASRRLHTDHKEAGRWASRADVRPDSKEEVTKLFDTLGERMAEFSVFEQQVKTKEFSSIGLASGGAVLLGKNAPADDPTTAAATKTRAWLRKSIDALKEQAEALEYEVKRAQQTVAGKAGKGKRGRGRGGGQAATPLDSPAAQRLARSEFHVSRLEQVLRAMDRGVLEPQDVDEIEYDVQLFVEGYEDPEYDEDAARPADVDCIYDVFGLVAGDADAVVAVDEEAVAEARAQVVASAAAPPSAAALSPSAVSSGAVAAATVPAAAAAADDARDDGSAAASAHPKTPVKARGSAAAAAAATTSTKAQPNPSAWASGSPTKAKGAEPSPAAPRVSAWSKPPQVVAKASTPPELTDAPRNDTKSEEAAAPAPPSVFPDIPAAPEAVGPMDLGTTFEEPRRQGSNRSAEPPAAEGGDDDAGERWGSAALLAQADPFATFRTPAGDAEGSVGAIGGGGSVTSPTQVDAAQFWATDSPPAPRAAPAAPPSILTVTAGTMVVCTLDARRPQVLAPKGFGFDEVCRVEVRLGHSVVGVIDLTGLPRPAASTAGQRQFAVAVQAGAAEDEVTLIVSDPAARQRSTLTLQAPAGSLLRDHSTAALHHPEPQHQHQHHGHPPPHAPADSGAATGGGRLSSDQDMLLPPANPWDGW